MENNSTYTEKIKEKALELGFDDIGFSPAVVREKDAEVLDNWLNNGRHADMHWMSNHSDLRKDPKLLVPQAKSVISVLLSYYTPQTQTDPDAPVVSKYAYGRDYHKVVKAKLKSLLSFVQELIPETKGRAFTDSAPVLEHAYARNAGLGWIGKNSLLISPKLGSYVFIGELIIDQELDYNTKEITDYCGNCTLCINECPTSAILPGRIVDANKCLSYHTIENKNPLPETLKNSFFNRVFGCDICQEVCPWNRDRKLHTTKDFKPKKEFLALSAHEWSSLNEESFKKLFEGTPVMRVKFQGLRRNILFLKDNSL